MDPTIFLEHRCVFCNRRLLISKTWHNNTDNHEKETEKQKLNFPLVAHTCSLDPDDDCQPFKSNSKVETLVSKKRLQSQKPEVPYLAFTSVCGNPPLYWPLPSETRPSLQSLYVNTTTVWRVTLRLRGTPSECSGCAVLLTSYSSSHEVMSGRTTTSYYC